MKNDNLEFMHRVMKNEVVEAKKIFEKALASKIAVKVSELRQRVAKEYFNKS